MRVYFQDEARFGRMDNPAYCWAPRGVRPAVASQRVRQSTYVYGAVSPQDGDLFSLILPFADTAGMEMFMERFAAHLDGQPTLLIMDGAAWHQAEKVVRGHSNIHVAFQPPYSPELNPAEHVWRHIRQHHMKNRDWQSLDEVEDALVDALQSCHQDRSAMRSLSTFRWMKGL